MKLTQVTCSTGKPEPIATGVEGGGYISIYTPAGNATIGMTEFAQNPSNLSNSVDLKQAPLLYQEKFYLNEGEVLYGQGSSTYPVRFTVVYYNQEPASQTNTQTPPINLTGTIQLNQQ